MTGSELWPAESLEAIHHASLQLLERAGLRVLSDDVREVLLAAGERVRDALAHDPVGLPDDILGELCRLIDACAREIGLAEWPDPRRLLETSTKVA